MLTKKISGAFKLALVMASALMLAGCLPPGPKALVEGQRRLERGDYVRAVQHLETAARLMSTNAHAWNFLGIAYHQSGDAARAERAYLSALKVDRNLLEARLNLGNLLLEQGRAADAKSEFTAYTLRRPTEAEGFERLAAAELRLRELAAAEAHARKALQLDATSATALNTLGLILEQRGRLQDAAQSFAGALRVQKDYAPALLNLAVVTHRQLGDRAGALNLYRQYLELKPRPADADAVAVVVRQLQQELAPPQAAAPPMVAPVTAASDTSVVTNRPVATAAPPVRQTVSPPTPVPTPAPPPGTSSSASVARTAPKPAVEPAPAVSRRVEPAPASPRTAPPEMVTLPPEPQIRTQPEQASVSTTAANRSAASAGGASKSETTAPPPASRSMWDSVNPLRLFRREPKPVGNVTPLPPKTDVPRDVIVSSEAASPPPSAPPSASPVPSTMTVAERVNTAAPPPSAGRSAFSRYEYRSSIPVPSGDRSKAEIYLSQGNAAMKVKDVTGAMSAFRGATEADPSWFQAHFNYAAAALEAGRSAEALSAGETAVALRPDSIDARYNFALALSRANYVLDAVAQLEKLLAMEPDNVRAHLALGNLYAEQIRLKDKAREHYQKVLKLAPRHAQAQSIRYWLVSNPR